MSRLCVFSLVFLVCVFFLVLVASQPPSRVIAPLSELCSLSVNTSDPYVFTVFNLTALRHINFRADFGIWNNPSSNPDSKMDFAICSNLTQIIPMAKESCQANIHSACQHYLGDGYPIASHNGKTMWSWNFATSNTPASIEIHHMGTGRNLSVCSTSDHLPEFRIKLICDPNITGSPLYYGPQSQNYTILNTSIALSLEDATCSYSVTFRTSEACPKNVTITPPATLSPATTKPPTEAPIIGPNPECLLSTNLSSSITNLSSPTTTTHILFNLTALSGINYRAPFVGSISNYVDFAVCGRLTSILTPPAPGGCTAGMVSGCQRDGSASYSLGYYTSRANWSYSVNPNNPTAVTSSISIIHDLNGSIHPLCKTPNQSRQLVLTFICDGMNNSTYGIIRDGYTVITDEKIASVRENTGLGCVYTVTMYTKEACPIITTFQTPATTTPIATTTTPPTNTTNTTTTPPTNTTNTTTPPISTTTTTPPTITPTTSPQTNSTNNNNNTITTPPPTSTPTPTTTAGTTSPPNAATTLADAMSHVSVSIYILSMYIFTKILHPVTFPLHY